MKVTIFSCFLLFALSAQAEEKRIYQMDSIGNIQYNKPSYTIQKDSRIIETYPVDSVGNIQ